MPKKIVINNRIIPEEEDAKGYVTPMPEEIPKEAQKSIDEGQKEAKRRAWHGDN